MIGLEELKVQKQPPEVFYEKKCSLKISQNSQENTRARVSFLIKFIKILLKKDLGIEVFPYILWIF